MALLTIIMPVYNASPFLKEAVESLLQQSFCDFELWMADDASTDDSLKIMNSFQDSRIKIFENEINEGRVFTVNKLVKKISTDYFTVTDADDVSHPKRLQKQIDFLISHPDYAMCGTSYWAIDEKGFLVREMKLKGDLIELRKEAIRQSQFLGPTTVMRKCVLDHFPDFYRAYFRANFADADLSCRILDRFKVTNIEEPLYFYRVVRNSVTRKKVTVRNLNLHLLIGFLSKQRREQGSDCLERDAAAKADQFLNSIQEKYEADSSLFFRHQAFFHLYWGLNDLALRHGWNALRTKPFYPKNILSLGLIIFRSTIFFLTRQFSKKHYTQFVG